MYAQNIQCKMYYIVKYPPELDYTTLLYYTIELQWPVYSKVFYTQVNKETLFIIYFLKMTGLI